MRRSFTLLAILLMTITGFAQTLTQVWKTTAIPVGSVWGGDARQGVGLNGVYYINNAVPMAVEAYNGDGLVEKIETGYGWGITSDDAGNIICRAGTPGAGAALFTDSIQINIIPADGTEVRKVTLEGLQNFAESRADYFGHVYGDVVNGTGYLLVSQNGETKPYAIAFDHGKVDPAKSFPLNVEDELMGFATQSALGFSYVDASGAQHATLMVRNGGKLQDLTLSMKDGVLEQNVSAVRDIPLNRGVDAGGEIFQLGGKLFAVYPSKDPNGSYNYLDGFEVADITNLEDIKVVASMPHTYAAEQNKGAGNWVTVEPVNETTVNIYHYYLNGYVEMCTFVVAASSELVNADFAQGVLGDINVATYEKDGTPNHMQEVPGWSFGVNNIDARAGGVVAYGSGTTFGGPSYGVPAEGPEGTNGKALAVLAVWTGTVQYVQNVTLPAGKYKMIVPVFNTAGTIDFVKNLIGVKYGETEKYATALSYPVGAWTVEAVEFELTEETSVTVSLGYEGANCSAAASQHLYYDCVKIGASVAPEVTLMGNDFETEFTLSEQSTVTFDMPISGIKVAGLDQEKDYNYNISEGSTTLVEGQLSVNVIGYAEFAPLSLYEGHTYTLTLTTGSETVATYTLIGAMEEEQNDLDFTDKVVKEVKANTSNIEEGKWYAWSNPRNVKSTYGAPTPFYDQGEGKKPKREAFGQTVRTVLSQNTPVSDVTKYLVRFVKSGTGEAYHIQFATGNYIKNDLTATATAEEAGLFMVYAATNSKADAAGEPYTEAGVGINITEDGVAYGKRLDGDGAGAELVTWGNSKIETPDANNVWFFEEVEMAEPTTETYTVHITGAPSETKVTYGEQEYGNDDTFDAKGFSLSQLTVPDHENYVKSVELDGTDIYVTYTYAKKVADLSEINNEHAYVLICERGQLTTNEGELAPTAEKSYTESKSVFALVQYNENYYLWSTAEEGFVFGDKSIAAEGEFQNVVLNAQEDGTFVLYLADTDHYINIDGTTTLFIDDWDTADAGNKYSIYEVETFDATAALTLLENFTTGINAVAAPAAPAAIYSLTGQRQQRLQKGINIVRRQKVIK